MSQKLVIQEAFFNSAMDKIKVLQLMGFSNADEFFQKIIEKLNDEFNFLEIDGYRFSLQEESKDYSKYGAFKEDDD